MLESPGKQPQNVFQAMLEQLHSSYLPLRQGIVADHIPESAKACQDDFGIVIATASAQVYAVGDTDTPFTMQSLANPFLYGLGLRQLGHDRMSRSVDLEPSGEAFHAISLHPETGKPRNPMINAGAIATAAQLQAAEPEAAEGTMLAFFSELAGRPLAIDQAAYHVAKSSGHRNRAIGHLLRHFNIIETDPEPALDLYFRQCAISVTCRDLAVMAATLACQGRNPITGASPLTPEITVKLLALMGTCGMDDTAGQWMVDVGIPAKSGEAGGLLAVSPGCSGIATYSPPLDGRGNSVRGVAVCRTLAARTGLSLFNQSPLSQTRVRRSFPAPPHRSRHWRGSREAAVLHAHREEILLLQVQGVLDFVAIERLAAELAARPAEVRLLILDLAGIGDAPFAPLDLLERQLAAIEREGLTILLAGTTLRPAAGPPQGGVLQRLPSFEHLDSALEAAEDQLLACYAAPAAADSRESIGPGAVHQGFLAELPLEHRQTLLARMERRRFNPGDQVIRRGEPGDELFVVASGLYDIVIELPGGNGSSGRTRLATFGPGMCFGEIAFIAGGPRSATIEAAVAGDCLVLDRASYDALCRDQPQVVLALLQAISCDLGSKLERTSLQLAQGENLR